MESPLTLASRDRRRRIEAILLGLAVALGIALRLLFVFRFPTVTPDGRLYLSIAETWSRSGVYGADAATPSFLRMPGYPAFLAGIGFAFGSIRPRTVFLVQTAVDLATCFVVGLLAAVVFDRRVGRTALVLALLCPFTANYVALLLTESLAIFLTALALLFGVVAWRRLPVAMPTGNLLGLGAAIGAGILVRPDALVLLLVFGIAFLVRATRAGLSRAVGAAAIVGLLSLAFLAPWTLRNAIRFGEFQPLVPTVIVGKGERVAVGFNRWVSTWILDYVSDQDVWWKVFSREPIDPKNLPRRAFGSRGDPQRTLALIGEYNRTGTISEALDSEFAQLAAERIRKRPWVHYVMMPLGRSVDMWLRPRTQMLPLESRWWEFESVRRSWISVGYAGINLVFLALATYGAIRNRRRPEVWLLAGFAILRTALIATVGSPCSPEERYTLEVYPAVLALAAAGLHRFRAA